YIILAAQGHPDAHEKVRTLTLTAQEHDISLQAVIDNDSEMRTYVRMMTPRQRRILSNSSLYTGIAAKKAKAIAEKWKQKFGL
ncbi:MAG: adenylosuccinate lyase, partial [Patescibacteria group bacterium]